MKKPTQRNRSKKDRAVALAPVGTNLEIVAAKVRYTGSPYHKDVQSFAGLVPQPRPDASICPRELAMNQDAIQKWLKKAIKDGQFGADWRQELPHHVWHREGGVIYEASLTNSATGEYHGYPLEADAIVRGLK